jgi:hypothetical protein
MNKYTINIIGDNNQRTIVKYTTTKPEDHLEYFKNLFEQWYKTYQIISIDIDTKEPTTSLVEI